MDLFLSTFWKAALPFGLLVGIFFAFIYGWQIGVMGGIGTGILFGILAAAFVFYRAKQFTANRPLLPDEQLIKEGGANHFFNGEAVGGWIYLTNSRFFFKSHTSNIQNHELTVPLYEIDFAERANTFGLIPNQLRVTTRDGQVLKFVVSGANEWANSIKNLI